MSAAEDRPATALLIRHGHTEAIGRRLVGRLPGVGLSPLGRAEVEALASRLAMRRLAAIYSSPLERAVHTAKAIARTQDLEVTCLDALTELDFGEWTGNTFDALDRLPEWRRFNSHRSTAPVPRGETAIDVQRRAVGALEHVRAIHRGHTVALVSHQDVIRSVILHCAGASLDLYDRFAISPASITEIELDASGWRILRTNDDQHTAGRNDSTSAASAAGSVSSLERSLQGK